MAAHNTMSTARVKLHGVRAGLGCTGTEAAEGSSVSETQIYLTLYTDGVSNMIPVLEKKRDKTTKIVCLNINIFCQLSRRLLDLFITLTACHLELDTNL